MFKRQFLSHYRSIRYGPEIMKYSTRTGSPAQFRTDCLIVTKRRARSVARALGVLEFVDHALANRNNQAGTATVIAIPTVVKNLVVVGGDEKSSSPDAYQKSIAAAANTLRGLTITSAVWCLNATTTLCFWPSLAGPSSS